MGWVRTIKVFMPELQRRQSGDGMMLPFSLANPGTAIVASPDPFFREQMLSTLQASHWAADSAIGGAEALAKLDAKNCQALLLDRWLADLDVKEVAEIARKRHPGTSVCVMEAANSVPVLAIEPGNDSQQSAIKNLPEAPRSAEPILSTSTDLNAAARLNPVFNGTESVAGTEKPLPGMIGSSPAMQQVYRLARLVAPRLTSVLILGATGTGKELVARAIHLLSPRGQQPFVTVNCAAIPETLLEAELFGHARGAFTGAFQARIGRLHAAHGGTLFLDEVGDLPLSMQAKLLRFLQDGEVQRLGSSEVFRVDVRVIGATNVDLAERVRQKAFREDLYNRLSVFPIEIQPLQQRVEDILPLSVYFLAGFCRESGMSAKRISTEAQAALENHSWPGNIRELRHVVERSFILAGNCPEILADHVLLQGLHKTGLALS
jgi:DNA-binding NtrC family response regulator